jgi:hypothetical protein
VGCDSLGIVDEEIYPQRTVYEGAVGLVEVGDGWHLGGGLGAGCLASKPHR